MTLEPKGLGASLRVRLGRFEVAPRDATFAVGAAGVRVVPSRPGRTLDVGRIGRSLVSDLASTTHLARFASTPPALTTEEAEKLDIRERVSEFTTYYSCCQPRVTNIQRAAQILDGTIVEPGESFSLNEALGKRTVEGASSPRRRSSTDGSRTRSAAASARSPRPSTTPRSSPA